MPPFLLSRRLVFPPPELADPDGLLAIGGDLSPTRLILAYSQGIFPWFSEGDPILWWTPSPRLILIPAEFHLPRRLARTIRGGRFAISADTAFAQVIAGCAAAPGRGPDNTWITPAMQQAYIRLHTLGFAHSIECRQDGQLVGGLYGVCLDRVFFGESMFSLVRDASKVALAALVQEALARKIALIDCQVSSNHLLGFGAREVSRAHFQSLLAAHIDDCRPQPPWRITPRSYASSSNS
ncbi:MAG: leucyl/phenylalanyl-tRNA--protein transferase [Desulfobulbus sp.]|jgi:leucyl/phenylalanyl-tRNA--protein transferase